MIRRRCFDTRVVDGAVKRTPHTTLSDPTAAERRARGEPGKQFMNLFVPNPFRPFSPFFLGSDHSQRRR